MRVNPADADVAHSFRLFGKESEIITFDEQDRIIVLAINDPLVTELLRSMFYFVWDKSEVVNQI